MENPEEKQRKIDKILDVINWLGLILLVGILAYVLGVKYGGSAESCKSMIKMFGCDLNGYSQTELNRLYSNGTNLIPLP